VQPIQTYPTTADGFDAETDSSVTFTAVANSSDGSSSSNTFTVAIADVNEFVVSAPVDTDLAANDIASDAALGTGVGITVSAEDLDVLDTVSLSLANDAGGRFSIDATTGEIITVASLATDAGASFSITVLATSSDGSMATASFQVNVVDVNDNAPIVTPVSFNITENAPLGAVVGTLQATDIDQSFNPQDWTIVSGNNAGIFAIDASTGQITVADPSLLDFELSASHTLSITVSDGVNTSASVDITILVDAVTSDIGALLDTDAAANQVDENIAPGSNVGITLNAVDADSADTVSYELSGAALGLFQIDAQTGVVTTAAPMDFENQAFHTITAIATSSDGSQSSADFTISISDVNENPTISDATFETGSDFIGVIGQLQVFDPDTNDTHTFQILNSNVTGLIVDDNGVFQQNGTLMAESRHLVRQCQTSKARHQRHLRQAREVVVAMLVRMHRQWMV